MAEVEMLEEEVTEKDQLPFLDIAHKVLLAGIGAVALAQSEIEEFVAKLVERGEIAEKDGRKMLKDVLERRKKVDEAEAEAADVAEVAVDAAAQDIDTRVEAILHRMNVPTKSDIDALGRKISLLADKVDQLKKTQEAV